MCHLRVDSALGAAPVTITDRHATGLARYDLQRLRTVVRNASDGAFRKVNEFKPATTAKGAKRQIREIGKGFVRTAWAHHSWTSRRGVHASWLVPVVGEDEIAACCVSLQMPAGGGVKLRPRPWLKIPMHAIARGHQRLRDSDWLSVQAELRTAAMQSAAVLIISAVHGLKQFAIPANRGLLIGEVADNCLRAKTYIVPPLARRWDTVLTAWIRFEQHVPSELSTAIEHMALDYQSNVLDAALEMLAAQLEPLTFLREPHKPGDDVVGRIWEGARAQEAKR